MKPEQTASNLCSLATADPNEFLRVVTEPNFLKETSWDNELRSIDVAIILRDRDRPELATMILEHLKEVFKNSHLIYHQAGVCYARRLDFQRSAKEAEQAVRLDGSNVHNLSLAARAFALAGKFSDAKSVLAKPASVSLPARKYLNQIAQFVNFCEQWDIQSAYDKIDELSKSGRYINATDVSEQLLSAIRQKRPYSFLRLGDGEGSWLSLNAYDEGCYESIYEDNRRSFLLDWFGTDKLIKDESFFDFALSLQDSFLEHDIIGISPPVRLDQEKSFLSTRGITSSINIMRHLDLFEGTIRNDRYYCSSSANLDLLSTKFFRELSSATNEISLITSQTALAPLFTMQNMVIRDLFHIPGDSRNFLRENPDSEPICQYPNYLNRINQKLSFEDQSGKVFLVGGGFVGKKYISTIKKRGGIAIDIGSVADHLVRRGFV